MLIFLYIAYKRLTNLYIHPLPSHTMIVICIMSTAMLQFHYYLRDKKVSLWTIDIDSVLMIAVTVIGRLISGIHWFTDIAAGILLSSALVALYYSTLKYIEEKKG